MFLEFFALSLLVALVRGGRLNNLKLIQMNGISFLFIAFGVQFLLNYMGQDYWGMWGPLLHLGSYLLLFFFIRFNQNVLHPLLWIGVFLNFLVILFNGGAMPVQVDALRGDIIDRLAESVTHQAVDSSTRLLYLADILMIPAPFNEVVSIGDLLMNVGLFISIQKILVLPKKNT